jgi:hypothetical protein
MNNEPTSDAGREYLGTTRAHMYAGSNEQGDRIYWLELSPSTQAGVAPDLRVPQDRARNGSEDHRPLFEPIYDSQPQAPEREPERQPSDLVVDYEEEVAQAAPAEQLAAASGISAEPTLDWIDPGLAVGTVDLGLVGASGAPTETWVQIDEPTQLVAVDDAGTNRSPKARKPRAKPAAKSAKRAPADPGRAAGKKQRFVKNIRGPDGKLHPNPDFDLAAYTKRAQDLARRHNEKGAKARRLAAKFDAILGDGSIPLTPERKPQKNRGVPRPLTVNHPNYKPPVAAPTHDEYGKKIEYGRAPPGYTEGEWLQFQERANAEIAAKPPMPKTKKALQNYYELRAQSAARRAAARQQTPPRRPQTATLDVREDSWGVGDLSRTPSRTPLRPARLAPNPNPAANVMPWLRAQQSGERQISRFPTQWI